MSTRRSRARHASQARWGYNDGARYAIHAVSGEPLAIYRGWGRTVSHDTEQMQDAAPTTPSVRQTPHGLES